MPEPVLSFPRFRRAGLLLWIVMLPALLVPRPARAVVVFQVSQQGPNVIVNGSGSAKLDDLTFNRTDSLWANYLTDTEIYVGDDNGGTGKITAYSGLAGPGTVSSSSGLFEIPLISTGDLFGLIIDAGNPLLVLPETYISETELNGTSEFVGTIAALGLPIGTTTWTWGTGVNADRFELRVDAGEPVPAPLPLAGAAAAFSWSRRLRSRIQARSSLGRPR